MKVGDISPPIKNINTLLFLQLTDKKITKAENINIQELKKRMSEQKRMNYLIYIQEVTYLN